MKVMEITNSLKPMGKVMTLTLCLSTFISTLITVHFNLHAYIPSSLGSLSAPGLGTLSYFCIFSLFLAQDLCLMGPQCVC